MSLWLLRRLSLWCAPVRLLRSRMVYRGRLHRRWSVVSWRDSFRGQVNNSYHPEHGYKGRRQNAERKPSRQSMLKMLQTSKEMKCVMAAAIRAKSNAKRKENDKASGRARCFVVSSPYLLLLLNPYLVGVLSSMAIQPSYRSYRARSTSATLNDFGTTIGSGAGVNVFHAFEPDIRHIWENGR